MLEDLASESAKHGLHLHPDKSKVLTNSSRATSETLKVLHMQIAVLDPRASLKYLGRKLCMVGLHDEELNNRISAAWATFTRHRDELTNKKYPLRCRLRLFEATVGATALYGCEAWTLKLEQQRRLRTTQRKMMRAILGMKRRVVASSADSGSSDLSSNSLAESDASEGDLEPWSEFLKRAAKTVECRISAAKQEEWLTQWRRRQWRWAGKLMRTDVHKWSQKVMKWSPLLHGKKSVYRAQSRPLKRWDTDLSDFMTDQTIDGTWQDVAQDVSKWATYEARFVKWALDKFQSKH